jgi:hypothetical protein
VHRLWTALCTTRAPETHPAGGLWRPRAQDYTSLTASTDGAEHGSPGHRSTTSEPDRPGQPDHRGGDPEPVDDATGLRPPAGDRRGTDPGRPGPGPPAPSQRASGTTGQPAGGTHDHARPLGLQLRGAFAVPGYRRAVGRDAVTRWSSPDPGHLAGRSADRHRSPVVVESASGTWAAAPGRRCRAAPDWTRRTGGPRVPGDRSRRSAARVPARDGGLLRPASACGSPTRPRRRCCAGRATSCWDAPGDSCSRTRPEAGPGHVPDAGA